MHCRPNVMAPIVYPTECCVNHSFQKTIVPHIHPSHTTNVNHHMFEHLHYYPHTQSAANEVTNQHFNAGPVPPAGWWAPPVAPAVDVDVDVDVIPQTPMMAPNQMGPNPMMGPNQMMGPNPMMGTNQMGPTNPYFGR